MNAVGGNRYVVTRCVHRIRDRLFTREGTHARGATLGACSSIRNHIDIACGDHRYIKALRAGNVEFCRIHHQSVRTVEVIAVGFADFAKRGNCQTPICGLQVSTARCAQDHIIANTREVVRLNIDRLQLTISRCSGKFAQTHGPVSLRVKTATDLPPAGRIVINQYGTARCPKGDIAQTGYANTARQGDIAIFCSQSNAVVIR